MFFKYKPKFQIEKDLIEKYGYQYDKKSKTLRIQKEKSELSISFSKKTCFLSLFIRKDMSEEIQDKLVIDMALFTKSTLNDYIFWAEIGDNFMTWEIHDNIKELKADKILSIFNAVIEEFYRIIS